MIYIGYFLLFFVLLRLMVAFFNTIAALHLPAKQPLQITPLLSILIPARNEAGRIEHLLNDLLSFDYPRLEIIVYNDHSSDQTGAIVTQFSKDSPVIRLMEGDEPPSGWLGKNFACHQLAKKANGEYLLFLDADVRVQNGLVERALFFTQKHHLVLLSIFPKQIMSNFGTQLSVPLMNWILLSLLPLVLVRRSTWSSFSAANGQFMLFDAATYHTVLPHKQFRDNKVEDIAIIRYFKQNALKVGTLLGDDQISCKMYDTLDESIDGFSKNLIQFFGGSSSLTLLFVGITTFAPFYLFYYNGLVAAALYLASSSMIRIFISSLSKQSVFENVILMPLQQITLVRIFFNTLLQKRNKTMVWKDRKIN